MREIRRIKISSLMCLILLVLLGVLVGCTSQEKAHQEQVEATSLAETPMINEEIQADTNQLVEMPKNNERSEDNKLSESYQEGEENHSNDTGVESGSNREDINHDTSVGNNSSNEVDTSKQEIRQTGATTSETRTKDMYQNNSTKTDDTEISDTEIKDTEIKDMTTNPNELEASLNQDEKNKSKSVIISISCANLVHNKSLDKDKQELVPEDGVILESTQLDYEEGQTVFDVLVKATKEAKIHIEYEGFKEYKTNYIEGIHNLYEFDCGPLSGWMYKVNGVFPNYGCSSYTLKEGDVVEWVYTCDLGKDVGAGEVVQRDEAS